MFKKGLFNEQNMSEEQKLKSFIDKVNDTKQKLLMQNKEMS